MMCLKLLLFKRLRIISVVVGNYRTHPEQTPSIDSSILCPDSRYFLEPSIGPLRTKTGVRQQYPGVLHIVVFVPLCNPIHDNPSTAVRSVSDTHQLCRNETLIYETIF